jgi:hypothetical protein
LNVKYACSVGIYEYSNILVPLPPYDTGKWVTSKTIL